MKSCALIMLSVLCLAVAQVAIAQDSGAGDAGNITVVKSSEGSLAVSYETVQHQTVSQRLVQPLRVRVLKGGFDPVPRVPVTFSVKTSPSSSGFILDDDVVLTDEDGYAQTSFTLGSKPGLYEVSARIQNGSGVGDIQYFRVKARESKWVFFLMIGLAGGLGLFLFGMNLMSGGMRKTAGSRLRGILSSLTNNRLMAVGVGTFVTMIIQSSSATTVMLVSFVQAQLMTFAQSLGVILGADIGTTITAQLIAFKLTDYALIFVAVGFGLMVASKSTKNKSIGETVLGFGLLFFGMKIMSEAMYPLRTYGPFLEMLLKLEFPLFGILIGALFTALIQSSSAFTGIIIILASQGLLTLEAGIPLLFGANLGTCVTAGLASINANREARRVALAHTMFKVFGIVLFFWWIPYFAEIVRWVSPNGPEDLEGAAQLASVVPRQVANAHTIFNVALTVLVLPFTSQVANWITRLLPDRPEPVEAGPCKVKYLRDDMIATPDLALSLAKVEVLRVGGKVKKMVEMAIKPFHSESEDTLENIARLEAEVDYLEVTIKEYLTKISQSSVPSERIEEAYQMLHTITELEQIADIVSKSMTELARKHRDTNSQFSPQGIIEIEEYHLKTVKQVSRAMNVFKEVNLEAAEKMEKKYKKYRLMEMGLRRTHFERLRRDIPESVVSSEIHMTLMDYLKRMSSHATNIARILLESKDDWVIKETPDETEAEK